MSKPEQEESEIDDEQLADWLDHCVGNGSE
jgi:hypothetical protein